jgi:hypothetical protein
MRVCTLGGRFIENSADVLALDFLLSRADDG